MTNRKTPQQAPQQPAWPKVVAGIVVTVAVLGGLRACGERDAQLQNFDVPGNCSNATPQDC